MTTKLSVIQCTWNNSARLQRSLDAIERCQLPHGVSWELVLVNNNCSDDTDAVAALAGDRLPLRYVKEPKPGKSAALNAGLAHAGGELLVFADDDVLPEAQWLRVYWDAFERERGRTFWGGPLVSRFEGKSPDPELLACAPASVRGLDLGPEERSLPTDRAWFVGSNWASPAEAFREVGVFDPELGLDPSRAQVLVSEETDIMTRMQRKGWQPVYLPRTQVIHLVPEHKATLAHMISRARAYGYYVARSGAAKTAGSTVPRWLWRRIIELRARSIALRLKGQRAYQTRLELAQVLGMRDWYRRGRSSSVA